MTPEEFRSIRTAAGMTLAAVAKYLGVGLRTVQRYEADPSAGPSVRRAISAPIAKLMRQLKEQR